MKIHPDDIRIHFESDNLWALNVILMVVMFGVALDIRIGDFRRLFRQPRVLTAGIVSQFLLMPLLTFLLVWAFRPIPSIALGMFMVGACPGGNISNFLSKLARGNAALSVSLTAFATLVAVVMTPFNFHFWAGLYPPTHDILRHIELNPWSLYKLVALILGLPLAAGMWVRHHYPETAGQWSRRLKPLSILVFILFIAAAFYNNMDIFTRHIHFVFSLVIIHNLLAYFLGYWAAAAFGLAQNDRRTIAIETGIQNSGLGLLLIFEFFHELGGMMMLAAWWGVWDIISGLALAFFWSKRALKSGLETA